MGINNKIINYMQNVNWEDIMFNFFDLSIIPTFLSRFKVKKILIIGLSNERILNEIIPYYIDNECLLYGIDSKINLNTIFKEYIELDENLKSNLKYYAEDSLTILPKLNQFDAIFIDDDSNWYTLYNELNIIKKNNSNFPNVFICNNKYPYKRRDAYTNPKKIPKENINEYSDEFPIFYKEDNETKYTMVKDGLYHAIDKDTPKNGVLTAIEDFLKENPKLEHLKINPIEGISLIYQPSKITDIRINDILKEKTNQEYDIDELSDKFIENDILVKYLSKINLLEKDIKTVKELKSEIKNKTNKINEYENTITIQENQIKYNDSKINNTGSRISLIESKLQNAEAKLLNSNNQVKEKEKELSAKDNEIQSKEDELDYINTQLLTKENELETTKNRLISLENNFLNVKNELDYIKTGQFDYDTSKTIEQQKNQINTLKKRLNEKNAQIKSKNRRMNALKNKYEKQTTENNNKGIKKIFR